MPVGPAVVSWVVELVCAVTFISLLDEAIFTYIRLLLFGDQVAKQPVTEFVVGVDPVVGAV